MSIENNQIFTKVFNVLKEGRMCCVNISVVIEPRKKRSDVKLSKEEMQQLVALEKE